MPHQQEWTNTNKSRPSVREPTPPASTSMPMEVNYGLSTRLLARGLGRRSQDGGGDMSQQPVDRTSEQPAEYLTGSNQSGAGCHLRRQLHRRSARPSSRTKARLLRESRSY